MQTRTGLSSDQVFQILTPSQLQFSLPWLDESSARELLGFADLQIDSSGSRIYKLNLLRCACLDRAELQKLSRYGIQLSAQLLDLIEKLSLDRVVSIRIQGSDLMIHATPSAAQLLPGELIYEPKTKSYRAKPCLIWELIKQLEGRSKLDLGLDLDLKLEFSPAPRFQLRDYQLRCYQSWRANDFRGVIWLPTAAGKSFLGMQAICELKVRSLILVPTIELLHEWKRKLISYLELDPSQIGIYGGGLKQLAPITIITYDSAYLNIDQLCDRYLLMIADEAHHAISPEFRKILELSIAKYRMGLTGTPLRSDGLHRDYPQLLGPVIQAVTQEQLQAQGYLAECQLQRIYLELDPEQMQEYRMNLGIYRDYCRRMIPQAQDPRLRFQLCLKRAAFDEQARQALRARARARQIALSAQQKLDLVGKLLAEHSEKKVLIFSRYTDLVRQISRRYLIPLIIAETSNQERKTILEMFRRGQITKLASGLTLEEGIDVPDAQVGIVISGSGSHREYLQRIGRLLRPKQQKALLIELVTRSTMDYQLSLRRRKFQEWIPMEKL